MSKYIKITNVSENVSRLSLEKLGLSTKRNNPDTIGQFGSGIKFAPIAALRNGWEWWFVGNDERGPYHLQYIKKEDQGIDCIFYDYGDDLKPSSFTIDAGSLSWVDAFQIYREAVSNAMDGAKEMYRPDDWSVDIVDEVDSAVHGEFSVYITAAPEIMKIYNNHDVYFSNNRDVILENNTIKILEPNDLDIRVYCHDVQVFTTDQPAIFHYCFDSIDLNEERTVKYDFMIAARIEQAWSYLEDTDAIERILRCCVNDIGYYEFSSKMFSYSNVRHPLSWINSFSNLYGDNAVIINKSLVEYGIENTLRIHGYNPVFIKDENAYELLKKIGIPNALEKLGEEVQYEIVGEAKDYPKLLTAISIARLAEPGLNLYIDSISVFIPKDERVKGLTINMDKKADGRRILISKDHALESEVSDIIATLIHEYDHASTGIADDKTSEGLAFRDLADKRIGHLVYENYKKNPFFIEDGMVCFSVSDIGLIGSNLIATTEHIRMMNCFFMKIGDVILKLKGESIDDNFGHAHEPSFIKDATVVCYPSFVGVEGIEIA